MTVADRQKFPNSLNSKTKLEIKNGKSRLPSVFVTLLTLGFVAIVFYFFSETIAEISWIDFRLGLRTIPFTSLLAAVILTLSSYGLLTVIEKSNLRAIGIDTSWRRAFFISATANAISNHLSLAGFSGAALRLRNLRDENVEIKRVINLCALNSVSLWTGFSLLLLLSTANFQVPTTDHSALTSWATLIVSVLSGVMLTTALLLSSSAVRLFFGFPKTYAVPACSVMLTQFLLSLADWAISGLALYILLPVSYGADFGPWIGVFLFGQVSGLLLSLPGGIGVLDALVLSLSGDASRSEVLGALVVYRVIFYFLPLAASLLAIGSNELRLQSPVFYKSISSVLTTLRLRSTYVISASVFVMGVVLAMHLDTDADLNRTLICRSFFPQSDAAVIASIVRLIGGFFILLSLGLTYRSSLAWLLCIFSAALGIFACLLNGFEIEYSFWLCILLFGLFWFRNAFHRQSLFFNGLFSREWILLAGLASIGLFGLVWALPIQARDPASLSQLGGGLPFRTFFQAVFYGGMSSFTLALYFLMAPPRVQNSPETAFSGNRRAQLEDLVRIVGKSSSTLAQLAFVGDKRFMLNEQKTSFIMFAQRSRTWVAMGDPLGTGDSTQLIRQFWQMADQRGGNTVFYQVRAQNLASYVDNGFHLVKIGEEALVDLRTFDLDKPEKRNLRNTYRRTRKSGVEFKIFTPGQYVAREPEFKALSDEWLQKNGGSEKRFSVGFYDPEYLARYHHAVLLKDGKIVAFANIWRTQDRNELSVDLMRYSPQAPSGSMDYLFLCLIRHGQENGFRWFNLGMAPLAGLDQHFSSPFWTLIASFIFENGERLYKFKGIQRFKQKYGPVWESRYIAYKRNLGLLDSAIDIAKIIARSPKVKK